MTDHLDRNPSIKQAIWRAGLLESSPAIRSDVDHAVAGLVHLAGTLAARTGADYDAPLTDLIRDIELRLHRAEQQAARIAALEDALRRIAENDAAEYDGFEQSVARYALDI